jgi:colanic acid biosynthesis glycosyl transferase WcaI
MRVLILAQYFPPDMGGGATRAYNVVKGLSLAGCDVTVVAAFPHYPTGNIPLKYRKKLLSIENDGDFSVVRTFVPPLASKGFVNRLLLFVSFVFSSLFVLPFLGKADVVWAANPNIISVFPSLMYKFVHGCPVIQNVDDLWPETLYDLGVSRKSLLARFGEFVARIAYRISSGITPISPAYVEVLSGKYGVDSRKIFVVPAGVDLDKFSCKPRHPLRRGRFRVLYIGAFSPAYDFDQVLRAAESLSGFSDIDFVIQGGGELAYDLKRKVKEYTLNNVAVVDKIVSRDKVAEILADADALLLPLNGIGSIELGISSKLYEYQAAGKPIICCSSGQPGDYIVNTNSGLVVKPGDNSGLADAILKLKNDYSLSISLGKNGRKFVELNVSIKSIGFTIKNLFERFCSSKLK